MSRITTRATGPAALVIALVALLVALGGTSYAAVTLAKNSVGTKQLKNNSVVTGKVKDGSLTKADFAAGQLPAGATGPAGPAGPAGAKGANGTNGVSGYTVKVTTVSVDGGGTAAGTVQCAAGTKPLGGGGGNLGANGVVTYSGPSDKAGNILFVSSANLDSWTVNFRNNASGSGVFVVYATCATVA